ncbi:TPA: hypothetical protein ACN32D_004632 [Vibrio parahaemolyticus]|uniref:hypothetical protein n=1 Tax=Vibrio parahaemolyticus TaxID=670 RepID=UPI00046F34AE|nr:hypothetical protein [Vibrio parahaemolyticus]EGQ7914996.1 hypothetical protein [Vibrio parahaemolyticus]EGQ8104462.1 hypothetical protein [Vibrio parahaemolyticus]EGV1832516.1 hypothetical protein [Vibrio parahaemolyticus]EHB9912077.1 hypothetical protein [Vibrio parahaemolyticus]EHR0247537.1 hypothetical protein [Vibrio parahaemolyticus]
MKDYSNCTPHEFKLMISAQLELAAHNSLMSQCEAYFRTVLEDVNETIDSCSGMISQFEEQLSKVRRYLQSDSKPKHSLRLNGMVMLDKTACEWLNESNAQLKQLHCNLKCYEEVHEMLMSYGI